MNNFLFHCDQDVLNNYLKLLAQRQVELEKTNQELNEKLSTKPITKKERFICEKDIILDTQTKLVWQKNPDISVFTWYGALKYVSHSNTNKGFFSYTDWRLPSIEELETALYFKIPVNHENKKFWASTVDDNNLYFARVINFKNSLKTLESKDNKNYVLLVRG